MVLDRWGIGYEQVKEWNPGIVYLTMSGPGVYDGGIVTITGPPPPADMAGGTAVIAFP